MTEEVVFVFGYGEVGKAIVECIKDAGYEVMIEDPDKGSFITPHEDLSKPLAIHICFPYTEGFVTEVLILMVIHKPQLTIIESTVPPKVFDILSKAPVVHSPVRGSHPHLYDDINRMIKFVSNEYPNICKKYYSKWKIDYRISGTAKELAAGKIFSVNWYGMEIAFAQMINEYCRKNKLDFKIVYELFQSSMDIGVHYYWNEEEKKAIPNKKTRRPTMYPGKIEGHCVIQDIQMALDNKMGSQKLWKWIIKHNARI